MSPNHASKLLLKNHPAYCTSQWHSACLNPLEYPPSLESEIHAAHDQQQMSSITILFLNAMAPSVVQFFFKKTNVMKPRTLDFAGILTLCAKNM
jgi:hypothetical protein